MKTLPVQGSESPVAPAIHLEFIRSIVEGGHAAGAEAVESFHKSLFLHRRGAELAEQEQERRGCEERVSVLEAQLRNTTQRLEGEDKFVVAEDDGTPDDQPCLPWNFWSRLMFASAALALVCLVVFGIFNISFNLLESGIVTFSEHPVRAYLWAALLPVGALAVKIGWDLLGGRRARNAYAWGCLAVGLLGVVAWLLAYASIYPSLSKTTEEQIRSLSVFDEGSGNASVREGSKTVDRVLVTGQAVAEIFLSAVLGIYMSQIYARHRPVTLALNPTFLPFDREREALEARLKRERAQLALAVGSITRLEHELAVFVAYAGSLYRREQAALRDRGVQQRRIIEEAAEALRTRLAALDESTGRAESEARGESRVVGVNGEARS